MISLSYDYYNETETLDACRAALVRQTFAAFGPAAFKDLAAGLVGYTLKETVLAGAVALLWLECSLRHALALPLFSSVAHFELILP